MGSKNVNDYGENRYRTFAEQIRETKDLEAQKAENFQMAENAFVSRLNQLIVDSGVLKNELSDAICVSASSLSGYLVGKHHPDMSTLLAISDYFDVSMDYLFGKSDHINITDKKHTPIESELLKYYRGLSNNRQHQILGEVKLLLRSDIHTEKGKRSTEKKK